MQGRCSDHIELRSSSITSQFFGHPRATVCGNYFRHARVDLCSSEYVIGAPVPTVEKLPRGVLRILCRLWELAAVIDIPRTFASMNGS